MSLQRSGPVWKGARLRLERADEVGLRFPVLIGWSDFYGGTAAPVSVAWASDGDRSGWVVWGGSQGLRAVPEGDDAAAAAIASATFEERPLVWISDARMLPTEVAAVVAGDGVRAGARPAPEVHAAGGSAAVADERPAATGREGVAAVDAGAVRLLRS